MISYDSSGARPLWQEWQHFSRTFPAAPAGTAKVRIEFFFDAYGKNYLDDCAIVAPVPGVTARGTPWSQTYVYDGFGNMTDKISDHSVMTVAMDPATNRIVGEAYDANGNMLGPTVTYVRNGQQITGPANTWDAENRLVFQVLDGKQYEYVYDPWGRRVVKHQTSPSVGWETTFYGAAGERVTWGGPNGYPYYAPFAGQMVRLDSTQREVKDRLGSVRALDNGQQYRYLPYGEEEGGPTPDGRVKFATYERDSTASAQDYAGQRYYSNVTGRFWSPDHYRASVSLSNPQTWNRYAYVHNDPVNFGDPTGLDECSAEWGTPCFSVTGTGETEGMPNGAPPGGGRAAFGSERALLMPELSDGEGGGGGGGGAAPQHPIGYPGALSDLNKENCYKMFGFGSADAATAAFSNLNFQIGYLGQLQVQSVPGGEQIVPGTPPPAQNIAGTNTVQINYDYFGWVNFGSVLAKNTTTGQNEVFNYLGAINQALGTDMTTFQLANLILLHEFEHTPSGGNKPQENDMVGFNQPIYNDCIK